MNRMVYDLEIALVNSGTRKSKRINRNILNYRKMLDSMLESAEIDFTSFFQTMLAVDAISETVNIGMVNYE